MQGATGVRLRTAGVAHINDLKDILRQKSGFGSMIKLCEKRTFLSSTCEPPIPWYEEERLKGMIEALPSCKHIMGSAEAPKLFAKAHERPMRGTKQLSKELGAVGLDGKDRVIKRLSRMTFFASWYGMDKMKSRVFADNWMCQIRRWIGCETRVNVSWC